WGSSGMVWMRRSGLVAGLAAALCGWLGVGSAWAASVSLCVSPTHGAAVSSGACSGAGTTVALPASNTDQQTLLSILPHVSFTAAGVGGKPTIRFSGVNVQVVSGSGTTSGTVNGEGNLIVGYAENPANQARTGSNDLIVGDDNGWSSYAQLV